MSECMYCVLCNDTRVCKVCLVCPYNYVYNILRFFSLFSRSAKHISGAFIHKHAFVLYRALIHTVRVQCLLNKYG